MTCRASIQKIRWPRTPSLIRDGLLPGGVACILNDQEWDLCLDYRSLKGGQEPGVVAFDEEQNEYALADTMEAFVRGLTRDLRHHVYAAQDAVGPHPDRQLMGLNKALGVTFAANGAPARSTGRKSPPGGRPPPAPSRPPCGWSATAATATTPSAETWSKGVLCCDIALDHREDLERRLQNSDFRWVLLHAPPRRLLESGFFSGVMPVALGD